MTTSEQVSCGKRPCQIMCLQVAVSSVALLAAYLLMCESAFLPCLLFGLKHPSTGDYSLMGESRSYCKIVASRGSSYQLVFHVPCITNVLIPKWSTATPASTKTLQNHGLPHVPVKLLLFFPESQCAQELVCASKSRISFPKFCVAPEIKSHWPQNQGSGSSSLLMPDSPVLGACCVSQNDHFCGRASAL